MGKPFSPILSRNLFRIFILLSAGFLLYSFMLAAPFKVMDDRASILGDPLVRNLNAAPDIFRQSFFEGKAYYRPLVSLSFAFQHHALSFQSFFYNLGNMALHLVNSLLVFALCVLVLKDAGLAFVAALLFVIHPVHSEAVANIPGRSILLCAFFELLAFCFYVLVRGEKKRGRFAIAGLWIFCVTSFFLALLSKESAIVFPLVILAYELIVVRKKGERLLPAGARVFPFVVVLTLYFFIRERLHITNIFTPLSARDYGLGIFTFGRSLLTYGRELILPYDIHFDRTRLVFFSFADPELWLTSAGLAAGCVALWLARKRMTPGLWFFLVYAVLSFIPVAQFVPIRVQPQDISAADHFLYVPSVGIFAALAALGRWLWDRNREKAFIPGNILALVVFGWMAFLAFTAVEQNIYATNETAMLSRSLRFSPRNSRVHLCLGLNYILREDLVRAEEQFREVLRYDPFSSRALLSLGTALMDQGREWEGLQEYEKIVAPGGLAKMRDDNIQTACQRLIEKYTKRLSAEPDNALLHYSLGVAYSKKGEIDNAVASYEKALGIDPSLANARHNLCVSYNALGLADKEQACWRSASGLEASAP